MTARGKKTCLIIGNMKFNGLSHLPGNEKDCSDLQALFKELSFDVKLKTDLTAEGMRNVLKDIKATVDTECFVCAITSHGNSNGIYGTDGNTIGLHEITDMFDRENCKQMTGKPKLFFFDACRGGKSEVASKSSNTTTDIPPLKSDILVAYATSQDYVSFSGGKNYGSWFIQALVEVIKENAYRFNITDILTEVNCKVGTRTTETQEQQSAEYRTSFRKQFFFFVPMEGQSGETSNA